MVAEIQQLEGMLKKEVKEEKVRQLQRAYGALNLLNAEKNCTGADIYETKHV